MLQMAELFTIKLLFLLHVAQIRIESCKTQWTFCLQEGHDLDTMQKTF